MTCHLTAFDDDKVILEWSLNPLIQAVRELDLATFDQADMAVAIPHPFCRSPAYCIGRLACPKDPTCSALAEQAKGEIPNDHH